MRNKALAAGPSNVVYEISTGVLGTAGTVLAIAGVIICPITSGDTAFRSARLILAEIFNLDQKPIRNRLKITIPLLAIGGFLAYITVADPSGFQVVWRYFSWANQTLAALTLWIITAYLVKHGKKVHTSLFSAIPAVFMTAVCSTYILVAQEGLRIPYNIGCVFGVVIALVIFAIYCIKSFKRDEQLSN